MNPTTYLLTDFLTAAGADNPLTGSAVASSSFATNGLPHHGITIDYDPDEADGRLAITVEASNDPMTVADSASKWRVLGVAARSSAIVTYAADTLRIDSTGAGTMGFLTAAYRDEPCQKIRIKRSETFTAAGSNQGNVRVVGYSYSG
jgi:hypothetical protein